MIINTIPPSVFLKGQSVHFNLDGETDICILFCARRNYSKGAMWNMQPLFFPEMEGENTT